MSLHSDINITYEAAVPAANGVNGAVLYLESVSLLHRPVSALESLECRPKREPRWRLSRKIEVGSQPKIPDLLTAGDHMVDSVRRLVVLHFNDVYQVEPGGDAERFATKVLQAAPLAARVLRLVPRCLLGGGLNMHTFVC